MRKIEFRWRTVFGWQYWNTDKDSSLWLWLNRETLGQYTGQDDKNGLGIYEGDVVKSTAKYTHSHTIEPVTRIGVVKYCPTVAEFRVFESEDPDDSFGLFPCAELEVLGNIWDSQEFKKRFEGVYKEE